MSNYILKKKSITCSCANPHTQLLVTLRNGRLKNCFTPGREREGEKERERERERERGVLWAITSHYPLPISGPVY